MTGTEQSSILSIMPRQGQPYAAGHPIGVVAERTGISPELLRVWERRYQAVEPSRSFDGQRIYSDADIERLRLLRLATAGGRSIGHVAGLSSEELARLVDEDEAARQQLSRRLESAALASARADVEHALDLIRAINAPQLETFLRRAAGSFGIPVFLDGVAAPLLARISEECDAGRLTSAQERVATAIVQRVLEGAIQFFAAPADAPNLLVAAPAGEQHVMGSVLTAAAAADGWRVTDLGPDLPASEIAAAAQAIAARVVAVSVGRTFDRDRVVTELRALRSLLPSSVPLVATSLSAAELPPQLAVDGIRLAADLVELRAALRGARA